MTVQTERLVTSRGHQYRQLVEHYWDPTTKRTRTRFLRTLGPVQPRFPRADPTLGPKALPLAPPHFGLLATRIMSGTLTLTHIIQAVHDMGEEMPPGELEAVGIRFDLGKKTLALLLWPVPPSPLPRP
ncbi:MAG: hypothetical protein ACYDFT_05140, partial [Thermoplasmata archaeon]